MQQYVRTYEQTTRFNLLARLHDNPGDATAWNSFVACYGPQIHAWCRRWNLQQADAEDVTQMVLLKVVRTLPGFACDPTRSFAGWLQVLARRARCDLLRARARIASSIASIDMMRFESVEACDEMANRLEQVHRQQILEQAMANVRERVELHTWEAFLLTVIENIPPSKVADRLQLNLGVVYRAKSVVQAMLRQEVRSLDPIE